MSSRNRKPLVTIGVAALELGVTVRQLQYDIREGAPVARPGRRGRGHVALFDVDALRTWRDSCATAIAVDRLVAIAGEIPELVAGEMWREFVSTEGPHKRALAGTLVGTWYRVTCSLCERLQLRVPEPDRKMWPAKINTLLRIYDDSGSVDVSQLPRDV
jgi:hypothetical protein